MAPSTAMALAALRRPATQRVAQMALPASSRSYSRGLRGMTQEKTMSAMQKDAAKGIFKDGGGPLFPGTFVPLPLSKISSNPAQLLQYQWWRTKAKLQGVLTVLSVKLRSMPSWTKRPRYQPARKAIPPTAKAMYREMLEAFAAGDARTLERLCLPAFARKLRAAVDRRGDKREEVRFELVRDTRTWSYPALASHIVHPVNPYDPSQLTEQAVVAVSSEQQLTRHDRKSGRVVPGSMKLQDKVEYVVLVRQTSNETYESTPWRIWGTTGATTREGYLQEMEVLEKEQAHRIGWKDKETK